MKINPYIAKNNTPVLSKNPCNKLKNISFYRNHSANFSKQSANKLRAIFLGMSLIIAASGCAANNQKTTGIEEESKYIYTVQEGDTLSSIVRQYIGEDAGWDEVSFYIDELAEDNNIENPSLLYATDENGDPTKLDISCFTWEAAKTELDKKFESGFSDKLCEIADSINCSEKDLAAVIFSESSFDTTNVNSTTSAAGLLQFTPAVLEEMGLSTDDVLDMSAIEQLDLVEEYLLERKQLYFDDISSEITDSELYTLVFLPAYVNREILVSQDSESEEDRLIYERNINLDIDEDGNISKSDLSKRVQLKYDEMLEYLNITQ